MVLIIGIQCLVNDKICHAVVVVHLKSADIGRKGTPGDHMVKILK